MRGNMRDDIKNLKKKWKVTKMKLQDVKDETQMSKVVIR